jgi:hypothetical protein
VTAAMARATAKPSGTAIRAPVIKASSSAPPQFHQAQLRAQEAALGKLSDCSQRKLSDCSQKERRGGRRQFQKTMFYPQISAICPRNWLAAPVWCRACGGSAGFTGPAKVWRPSYR